MGGDFSFPEGFDAAGRSSGVNKNSSYRPFRFTENTGICDPPESGPHYTGTRAENQCAPVSSPSYAAVPRILTFGPQKAIFPQPRLLKQPGLFLSVSFRSKTTAMPIAPIRSTERLTLVDFESAGSKFQEMHRPLLCLRRGPNRETGEIRTM
jgi:hypothetical protein